LSKGNRQEKFKIVEVKSQVISAADELEAVVPLVIKEVEYGPMEVF
jgi:hypothetical protein